MLFCGAVRYSCHMPEGACRAGCLAADKQRKVEAGLPVRRSPRSSRLRRPRHGLCEPSVQICPVFSSILYTIHALCTRPFATVPRRQAPSHAQSRLLDRPPPPLYPAFLSRSAVRRCPGALPPPSAMTRPCRMSATLSLCPSSMRDRLALLSIRRIGRAGAATNRTPLPGPACAHKPQAAGYIRIAPSLTARDGFDCCKLACWREGPPCSSSRLPRPRVNLSAYLVALALRASARHGRDRPLPPFLRRPGPALGPWPSALSPPFRRPTARTPKTSTLTKQSASNG